MASPNRLAGTAYISVDGQSLPLVGDFEYTASKVSRETLTGNDTVHGFSEKPIAGYIAATIRKTATLSLEALNAMDNVTIVVELNNGTVVIGRNMWAVEQQNAKMTDATIEMRWEGPQGCVKES